MGTFVGQIKCLVDFSWINYNLHAVLQSLFIFSLGLTFVTLYIVCIDVTSTIVICYRTHNILSILFIRPHLLDSCSKQTCTANFCKFL